MNKEIEQLINEFAKKRYQEGYDDGYKDGAISGYMTSYQEGLNDAWECARKIICDCNYPHNHLRMSVVKGDTLVKFFTETSASEAIAEIKDYEEKQKQKDDEIRVGDEVYIIDKNHKSVVTSIIEDCGDTSAVIIGESGRWAFVECEKLNKTGKHYDAIEEVLKELRGDAE